MTSSRRSAREEWARSTGARDTRLHRDVALKVLPDAFAADPERLARFEREAQALAALNHPHIAAIHGVEENASTGAGQGTVRALVLELVDGETLAERIARGPLPTDEAVRLARQIADALEAAHEQGVIHRDLKPANIKITPDGNVKVLDFGLAKLASVEPSLSGAASGLSMSPTMTSPALVTGAAVLLGTAGYMAPEQARGRTIDKRADIWAFGVVLYEMLTGRRAFDGDSVTEVAGAVIHKEPDWRALPAATPPTVRLVLERCLQKDPKQRFRDIGDVRLALDGALVAVPPPAAAAPARRRVRELAIVAALAALAALASGAAVWMATPGAPPRPPCGFRSPRPIAWSWCR
jgi:serine/threonine-protein kinase